MPLPLIWLGLGAGALIASHHLQKNAQRSQVKHFPGETDLPVRPENGAVVCCGIYGAFDHSGIWIDDMIIERAGNGLIRAISPARFVAQRSGEKIFVACDGDSQVLAEPRVGERAAKQVYQYTDYHLLKNNCHQFVADCLQQQAVSVVFFNQLNQLLAQCYNTRISWHPMRVEGW